MVIWNCDSVVSRMGGFQDDVAAHLVYPPGDGAGCGWRNLVAEGVVFASE